MSLLSREEAGAVASRRREEDERVVFTNGCFDLLHRGHLHLLEEAARQGDHLIVGLNSDASVRRLKGPRRPVLPEEDRAALLDALACVDDVVLFSEDTPEPLIQTVAPDVLVKGADYEPEEIVGARFVRERGGRVHRVELMEGKSTTGMIRRLRGHDASGEDGSSSDVPVSEE